MTDKKPDEIETREQPPMVDVCRFIYKNGGTVDSKSFGKEFDLEPDFSLRYMAVLESMSSYPLVIDKKEKTISLSPDGERVFRIAEMLVKELKSDYKELADATMRFLISTKHGGRDMKEKKWDVDQYMSYCFDVVSSFLNEKDKDKFHESFEDAWSSLNAYYMALHPDGWKRFLDES